MKDFNEKDALWLGGLALIGLAAYALYTHAQVQSTINSMPALTTAPNVIAGSPISISGAAVTMPVYAPVSAPDLGYQVSPMPADFATLAYQLPTIPDSYKPPPLTMPNSPPISAPSPPNALQQLLDPLGIFS